MLTERSTLAQFLLEQHRDRPGSSGEVESLVLEVAMACTAVSERISAGALGHPVGAERPLEADAEQRLDLAAKEIFSRIGQGGGGLVAMSSTDPDDPYVTSAQASRGRYLLTCSPLDGSCNIDVNVPVGSVFSVLRASTSGEHAEVGDFLQPGRQQVAAGYAIYGPATVLVLSLGEGVHAFTLDPVLGEFIWTRKDIRIPETAAACSVDTTHRRSWVPTSNRLDDRGPQAIGGRGEKDCGIGRLCLVAEVHRVLLRGGVFMSSHDARNPAEGDRLRLLHEANPVAMLVEQAGGLASTGRERVLDVQPTGLHQRIGVVLGSRDEVARLVRDHARHSRQAVGPDPSCHPLYGPRGLFRRV